MSAILWTPLEELTLLFVERTVAANNAATEQDRRYLEAERDGVLRAIGRVAGEANHLFCGLAIMAADNHYLKQGIDRPMCGGLFLDWKPLD